MNKNSDFGFMFGMAFLAIVLAVAAYFFLISPALASRSAAIEAERAASDFNLTLENRIAQYEAEAAKLPEIEAEIEEIRTQLAPQEDVPVVRRDIAAILAAESIIVESETVSIPGLVVPGQTVLAPAAYAVGRESVTDGLQFQDLYGTAIDMEWRGTYANIIRAVAKLQMSEDRYYLVTNLNLVPDTEEEEGIYRATVQVYFFTLVDQSGAIDAGTNSSTVDPETGEQIGDTEPGDALRPLVPWVAED